MIFFKIPGTPTGKQRPKFGNGRTYTPSKTVNYETLVQYAFIESKQPKIIGQIRIDIVAYYPIPKSATKGKRLAMQTNLIRPTVKPDWDNVGKIISDSLNGLAYDDDKQIVVGMVAKLYSDNPRVEVTLTEVLP